MSDVDYTFDSPDRTFDGEWGVTFDGGFDLVEVTPSTGTEGSLEVSDEAL